MLNGGGNTQQALAVFRLIVGLYPDRWNAYDSLGEALLKTGQKDEAIRMYRISVELNPNNQHGKQALERLIK